MCGIVACVSDQCIDVLLDGLSQLKNRGYDSAGVATLTLGEFRIDKFAFNAYAQLESHAPNHAQSTLGIAHTRWATHGSKTNVNAHPHLSGCGKFAIVHNGILKNYEALKTLLEEKGFVFVSQTDSEVIAHLLSLYSQTKPILECIQELNQILQGSCAIAILCIETQEVYCTGAPLLVGYNKHDAVVVSEKSGFCQRISEYFVLNPKDICKLVKTMHGVQVTTLDDYSNSLQILNSNQEVVSPTPYAHWTLKEIHEQPAAALRAMEGRIYPEFVYFEEFQMVYEDLLMIDHLILLGCGTSYFAGLAKRVYDSLSIEGLVDAPRMGFRLGSGTGYGDPQEVSNARRQHATSQLQFANVADRLSKIKNFAEQRRSPAPAAASRGRRALANASRRNRSRSRNRNSQTRGHGGANQGGPSRRRTSRR